MTQSTEWVSLVLWSQAAGGQENSYKKPTEPLEHSSPGCGVSTLPETGPGGNTGAWTRASHIVT